MNNILEIKNLSKNYHTINGEIEAIKDISLNVKKGEIVGVIGSSGCGKSTLLSILSNLEKPSGGIINHDNLEYSYMLQNDALLPWLNVLDNACLGLELKKIKTKENILNAKNLLIQFGLENFLTAFPNNLSGGMRQRVVCM